MLSLIIFYFEHIGGRVDKGISSQASHGTVGKSLTSYSTYYPIAFQHWGGKIILHILATLNRAGIPKDDIGEMLGHADSIVIEHFIASMDAEKTFKINSVLL